MTKKNMFGDYIKKDNSGDGDNEDKLDPASNPVDLPSTDQDGPELNKLLSQSHRSLPFPQSILPWSISQGELTNQLLNAGYTSIKIIATATVGEIQSLTQLSEHQIEKLIQNAKSWQDFNFETAAALLHSREQMHRISTGSTSLDHLLGGGIEPRSITEFYGAFTSGKTQLSIQLAVNALLNPDGNLSDGYTVYIDTEGSFRPERVVQITKSLPVDAEDVLNRILVGRAHNTNIQMHLVNSLVELASQRSIRLVIIDSLTSNFRSEFIGKDTILERQQKLNQHVQQLMRISDLLDIAVVLTNQVMSVMDGYEHSIQPVGGNIVAHGTTHRIELTKSISTPNVRHARLIASPSQPEGSAPFKITTDGIKDVYEG